MTTFKTHYRAMQASDWKAYTDKQDYIIARFDAPSDDYSVVSRAEYKQEVHGYLHSISLYIDGAIITLHVRQD